MEKKQEKKATEKELQLMFYISKLPTGIISTQHSLPYDYEHLSMNVLRSLEKKGFAYECRTGLWGLTPSGKSIVSTETEPLPPLTTSALMRVFATIGSVAGDEKQVKKELNMAIKKYINPKHQPD